MVHCKVSDWGEWGACSVPCGSGVEIKMRSVVNHPDNGGAACPDLTETRPCNEQACGTLTELSLVLNLLFGYFYEVPLPLRLASLPITRFNIWFEPSVGNGLWLGHGRGLWFRGALQGLRVERVEPVFDLVRRRCRDQDARHCQLPGQWRRCLSRFDPNASV
jgi:hypothetical protein